MITLSKSFREFISSCDNKIASYLEKYYRNYHIPVYKKLFTNEEIDYLTFRNDGTISFLPKGKEHQENDDGTWKRDGRQNGKPSKVIQKIITPFGKKLFKEKDFENFTNCYKVEFNDEGLSFSLLPNKDIAKIYNAELVEGEGSINKSCMKDEYSSYFDIYTHCKDLQILVLKKGDLVAGRALVWDIKGLILMDRIYVAKEHYFEMFYEYARENKWWRKYKQSYDYKTELLSPEGEQIDKSLKIYTDTDFENYPYIDTFTYGDDGMLTNDSSSIYTYTYNNTDGTRQGGEDDHSGETWDEIDEQYIDEEDAVEITMGRRKYTYTHYSNTITDVDGEIWYESDDDLIEINDRYYPSDHDDICYDELNSEYILIDDSILITKGTHEDKYTVEDETTEDHEGEIWADCDRDVLITEIGNDWYAIKDVIEIEGIYYLEDDEDVELIEGEYKLKTEIYA